MNKNALTIGLVAVSIASLAIAEIPMNALNAFSIYSHNTCVLADHARGHISSIKPISRSRNSEESLYLHPTDSTWSKQSPSALVSALKAIEVPGLDWTGEEKLDDQWLTDLIEPLIPAPNFRYLALDGTHVTDRSIPLINRLTNLEVLTFSEGITDKGLAQLRLPHLKELRLGKSHVTDQGIKTLAASVTLRQLDLGETAVTAQGLMSLAAIPLDQLRLNPEFDDASVSAINRFKTLGQLDLSESNVTDKGIIHLGPLPVLHTLFVPEEITDSGLVGVKRFKNLRRLDLTDTSITDEGLRQLTTLTKLEELSLSGTLVTDASVDTLVHFPKLRTLNVARSKMSGQAVDHFAELQRLEVLSFSCDGSVKMRDLKTLQAVPGLRTMVINGRAANSDVLNYVKATNPANEKRKFSDDDVAGTLPTEQLHERHAPVFSGLREIHQMESDLDHVVPAIQTAQISSPDEDNPKNFLGEFNVESAGHSKIHTQ